MIDGDSAVSQSLVAIPREAGIFVAIGIGRTQQVETERIPLRAICLNILERVDEPALSKIQAQISLRVETDSELGVANSFA